MYLDLDAYLSLKYLTDCGLKKVVGMDLWTAIFSILGKEMLISNCVKKL